MSVDTPCANVLFVMDFPKFSRFNTDACFGFGDDKGERLDPILSIVLTLSREEFRFSGGKAFIVLPNGGMPLPSGGSGA